MVMAGFICGEPGTSLLSFQPLHSGRQFYEAFCLITSDRTGSEASAIGSLENPYCVEDCLTISATSNMRTPQLLALRRIEGRMTAAWRSI